MELTRGTSQPERRASTRLPDPPCSHCHSAENVRGVVRTDYVVYFRCSVCGDVWTRTLSEDRWIQELVATHQS